jgi:hypothetical protein
MALVPDTKDWTWVLDRPCPECGFDTTAITGDAVPQLLRASAVAWLAVLGDRDDQELRARPSSERWSTLEYACHVRDVFKLADERLRLMLEHDDPTFSNWDQDATAVSDAYNEQDPAIVAPQLRDRAVIFADSLSRLGTDAWTRRGRRSDGARFRVDSFARYIIHDPIHHLADVGAPLNDVSGAPRTARHPNPGQAKHRGEANEAVKNAC